VGTFIGERAIYNTETKEIKAVDIKTDKQPISRRGPKGHFDHPKARS